jgi:hypothetical protein
LKRYVACGGRPCWYRNSAIQPDPNSDGHTVDALHLCGMLLHRALHGEGCVTRPHGMVLMRQRGAEQRYNAVTHDLVHGALIAVHRRHHVLDDRVEQLAGFFGVAVGQQFHRALQVGEEDGDPLALAF